MISVPEVVVERVAAAIGSGESLADLAARSARAVGAEGVVAVIAATFSNPERFPSLAVRVTASLGLPSSVAAFDMQMACSAYPYALYLAGRLSSDMGGKVLVIDGDVQSPLVDGNDHATGKIFSDACTATVVSSNPVLCRHGSVEVPKGLPLVFSRARLLCAAPGESVHGAPACRRA